MPFIPTVERFLFRKKVFQNSVHLEKANLTRFFYLIIFIQEGWGSYGKALCVICVSHSVPKPQNKKVFQRGTAN